MKTKNEIHGAYLEHLQYQIERINLMEVNQTKIALKRLEEAKDHQQLKKKAEIQ